MWLQKIECFLKIILKGLASLNLQERFLNNQFFLYLVIQYSKIVWFELL